MVLNTDALILKKYLLMSCTVVAKCLRVRTKKYKHIGTKQFLMLCPKGFEAKRGGTLYESQS